MIDLGHMTAGEAILLAGLASSELIGMSPLRANSNVQMVLELILPILRALPYEVRRRDDRAPRPARAKAKTRRRMATEPAAPRKNARPPE